MKNELKNKVDLFLLNQKKMKAISKAKPFIKWGGGKGSCMKRRCFLYFFA